jgi:hypothetical protein
MERIDRAVILTLEDNVLLEPLIEEILRRDKDVGLLQIDFPYPPWKEMLNRTRERVGTVPHNAYPVAPSFKGENGGCFFAWYTAAITGNGDIRPCCLLLNPSVKPLGNIHDKPKFADHWNGPEFAKMRDEMREVLLLKGKKPFKATKFEILKEPCVIPHMCYLKNMFFQGDEEFYAEMDRALTATRKKEIRFVFGNNTKRRRAIQLFVQEHPRVKYAWDWFRERSRPARIYLKQRLGMNITDAV